MNPVSAPLVGWQIDWLAGLLLHSVWLAAAAAALSWIVLRRIRDPQVAHRTAAGGLLLIMAGVLSVGIATWPRFESAAPIVAAPAVSTVLPMPMAIPESAAVVTIPHAATRTDWRSWLVLAWSCGVLAMSLRHACGWWQAMRLRRMATRLTGGLADRLATLCHSSSMTAPLLLASTRIAVPAAIGWWRPAILIPAGLLTGLPPAQLDALLLHELAHLRRHDWLVEIAVSLIEGLLFFHPAVWWLGGRLRQAREQCCDSQAVNDGAEPDGLARALLALAERTAPGSPALAASGGMLADRVRRLLGLPARRERSWRALTAIVLLPVLLVSIVACTKVAAKATPHELAANLGNPVSQSDFPLARRIRAHADGRQMAFKARMIAAPAEFWSGLGLADDGQQVLDSAQTASVLAAVQTDPRVQILESSSITSYSLQRCNASFIKQYAYFADYDLVNGLPDPIISVLSFGHEFRACAEPIADGIVLVEVGVTNVHLLGTETFNFTWPVRGSYPLEMPVCLIDEGKIAPETRLGLGETVAVPLVARVQRSQPNFRYAIEHGTIDKPIPDPDLNARPRSVCLFTAEAFAPSEGRLATTPEATSWLDGTRVTLDVSDAPLDEALKSLATQLPVPIEVARDADYAATRVSLGAHDEPARAVLGRLLSQCLLDGSASVGLLRLKASPMIDFPGSRLGLNQTAASRNKTPPQPSAFETLPGPAWETPIDQRYDVRDLLLAHRPKEPGREGWTITAGDPASRLFSDTKTVAAVMQQAVCTSTWSAAERRIVPEDDGLIVFAAPAVQRAIADELTQRRSPPTLRVRLELVRLDTATWTNLGLASVVVAPGGGGALDDQLRQRVFEAAAPHGPLPAALEVTTYNGAQLDAQPDAASWWDGFNISVMPVLSQDRRYVTVTMRNSRPKVVLLRTSVTFPVGRGLISGLGDGIALMVHVEDAP